MLFKKYKIIALVLPYILQPAEVATFPGGSEGKESPAMQETWVWSLGQEDPLEKGMANHSRVPAWRIAWTEEASQLYSPWHLKESDTTEWIAIHFTDEEIEAKRI